MKTYYTYILTNSNRSVLYTGITNSLSRRLVEHYEGRIEEKSFTGRYKAYHLIYFEEFDTPMAAIDREKQIKRWSRSKKIALIATMNPTWKFLETEL